MSEIYGNVKASEAENAEHEPLLNAKRVAIMPTNQQKRYAVGTSYVYEGTACRGLPESSDGWIVERATLDAAGRPTAKLIGYGAWSDYLTLDYA